MVKFFGNVNGVEYTDIDKYNAAVADAIKSGKSYDFKSYSRYVPDEKPSDDEGEKDDKNVIDFDSIKLTNSSRRTIAGEYVISDELVNSLKNASNKDELIEKIKLSNIAEDSVINLSKKGIQKYRNEIKSLIKCITEAKHKKKYYNSCTSIINGSEKDGRKNISFRDIVEAAVELVYNS